MIPLSMSQARSQLTQLPGKLQATQEPVEVTSHGKPVLAILPWELYEALEETIEILGDDALAKQLHESIHQMNKGKWVSLAQVKKNLRLK